MKAKLSEKQKAILLRKQGKVYSEILKEIPVAKSTLSLWLREVGLAKRQLQRVTKKRIAAQMKGARARRIQRLSSTEKIMSQAKKEVGSLTRREFWLIGVVLYWGEGSKEKEYNPGNGVTFMNSDPEMISLFLRWLSEFCDIKKSEISFRLHIHDNNAYRIEVVRRFWAKTTGFPRSSFQKIQYKKHKVLTKRRNIGDLYYGCLQVKVKASSTLLRRIRGWTEGIICQ